MGKVLSVAVGKIQRFNVENRAHRVISRDKPVAAPKFESNIKDLERVLRDHPEFIEQAGKKDSGLDDRLKKVFVTSSDYLEQRRKIDPSKPLPTQRTHVENFELGFKEPDVQRVTRGKCTLRQAIQFISDHQQTPKDWPAERIASEFKLDKNKVDDILKHFRMFSVHIPKTEGQTKKILINPFKKKTLNFPEMLKEMRGENLPKPEQPKESKSP